MRKLIPMHKKVLLFATLLLTASLAGCAADSEVANDPNGRTNGLADAPVASLLVYVEGNQTLPGLNGTIETKVGANITFDASGSTGGNLTYAWDFGDGNTSGSVPVGVGGSSATGGNTSTGGGNTSGPANTTGNSTLLMAAPGLYFQPGNQTNSTNASSPNQTAGPMAPQDTADGSVVTYAYGAAGNYTVTLYVTNEAGETDMTTMDLTVLPAGPAPGTVVFVDSRKFSDSRPCSATDFVLSPAKTSTFEWEFNETVNDTAAVVMNVTITGGPTDTKFIGPDGKVIASGASIDAKGPFPAGKYKVTATSNCGTASTSPRVHNLNASATYVAQ